MALKYLVSNTTYDFGGPQYTNIGGSKRLNYIASGKTHQLGMATDKTCSQYSPLVMKVNGTNYYIGRSQSGSYITSDSISSTRLNTYTSGEYSTQSRTYYGPAIYTNITGVSEKQNGVRGYITTIYSTSYTDTVQESTSSYLDNWTHIDPDGFEYAQEQRYYYTYYTSNNGRIGYKTLTSTNNVYYTTIITNGVNNTTVSTTKSASSSSHNFV